MPSSLNYDIKSIMSPFCKTLFIKKKKALTKLNDSMWTDLFDQGGWSSGQIQQHVTGLTLSVVGQQLQELRAGLISLGHFSLWSRRLVEGQKENQLKSVTEKHNARPMSGFKVQVLLSTFDRPGVQQCKGCREILLNEQQTFDYYMKNVITFCYNILKNNLHQTNKNNNVQVILETGRPPR